MINSLRDFLKLVLKSITLAFWLVDVKCKDWAAFIEISFTNYFNIKSKFTKSIFACIPIYTNSDNFLHEVIYILFRKNNSRGLINHLYQISIV